MVTVRMHIKIHQPLSALLPSLTDPLLLTFSKHPYTGPNYYQSMTEFSVTKWIDLGNKQIELLFKDTDENPIVLEVHYDSMEIIDNNKIMTRFTDCNKISQQADFTDGNWLVHPYTYSYSAVYI
jgi:hypothetical protein